MSPAALLGWTPFSYPFNLTQQPACTVPCGLTATGLPIGLQFVGPMFGDALVLRAARAYESVQPIPRPVTAPRPSGTAAVGPSALMQVTAQKAAGRAARPPCSGRPPAT